MDYLISPFGFPPVGYELPQEIDDQISTNNINTAYEEVYALLLNVCENDLWRKQFSDQNRVEQIRFFSTAKYYYLSGFQIRGLAELHLALKYHLDTTTKLEDSRSGYSGVYCFDLQSRIDSFEQTKLVSTSSKPTIVASWTKMHFNADLSVHENETPYTHASYPLHYLKLSQANSLNLVRYEDFFPLFKELGIQDFKTKKYVLSFFEAYIFDEKGILRVNYSEKRLCNAKIMFMHILGRFLCVETQIVCEYLEAKYYKWNSEVTCEYGIFFSTVLNSIFGFIDDLIILKEKALAKVIGSNTDGTYQLFKSFYLYNFEKMESPEIVDQLNSINYQPIDDESDIVFNTAETDFDYKKSVPDLTFELDTPLHFPQQANSDSVEFINVSGQKSEYSLESLEEIQKSPFFSFETEANKHQLSAGGMGNKITAADFNVFDMDDLSGAIVLDENTIQPNSENLESPPPLDLSDVKYLSNNQKDYSNSSKQVPIKEIPDISESSLVKAMLDSPYDETANIRIANAKGSVELVLMQKELETRSNEFDSTFDLRSTDSFITHDTSVKHDDIVKKVTESRQLLTLEEKRKAVAVMHEVVKIKHPFLPRLTDVAAWTILTKKWLHLLSFAESNSIVNIPITNRSTYFDLMCLKQNVLKSWSKLESGYLQHQYLKSIAFDVFNTIYETWEYRQYIDDMSKKVIDKAVSLTKLRCAYNLTTHETIEWSKLTDKQHEENMFIESFQYKFDIVLPEMRKDKVSDLKTAFTQLYDNVQDNYMKVFGKYPGASHIFRMSVIIFDLLVLNAHENADYSLELQDDIFSVLSEFKADFHDARKLDGLNEDKFYIQAILADIEPFVRRRISPEKFLSFA